MTSIPTVTPVVDLRPGVRPGRTSGATGGHTASGRGSAAGTTAGVMVGIEVMTTLLGFAQAFDRTLVRCLAAPTDNGAGSPGVSFEHLFDLVGGRR